MFIQTCETPNPATLKFLPGRVLMKAGQVVDFPDQTAASSSPLAMQLFAVEGVDAVFFGHDFVSVTKTKEAVWAQIKPDILGIIMDYLASEQALFLADAPAPPSSEGESDNQQAAAKIREIIETRVRPAVAQDGGDIVFHRFEKGIVHLQMRGACAGCPSSIITLKNGVENLLRYYVPEVISVEAQEDGAV